ncbi:serine/arginine repetitive matrix protein 1-like [Balaenoptera acutorostrata]|uniref:Serine/arginine repetitive matrix protein 1-like n=1 Tax=Balaenoptera acutorostrata TaxID=9767 RepID=A0ABM3S2V6_BALAC|nr:serine/arginine repetitive matrix protein 1-like [Balaenoptera acutorostrata]
MEHSRNGPTFHPLQGTDIKAQTQLPTVHSPNTHVPSRSLGRRTEEHACKPPPPVSARPRPARRAGSRSAAGAPASRGRLRLNLPSSQSPPSSLPSFSRSFLPSSLGRRKESPKCQQPAPALRTLGRRPAARPSRRPAARPRPAPRGPLPRYLKTGGRRPRQPQRWPGGARRCTSLISNQAHSCLQRSRAAPSPPPRTLRKAASPHLHSSSARVFPAFPNAPDPPSRGLPHPRPLRPSPSGRPPEAGGARREGPWGPAEAISCKVKRAPNAKGDRKNTAPRPLTEPRNLDSRRSARPNGLSALRAPQGCTQHPKVETCRNMVNWPGDPPSCSGLPGASTSRTQLGQDLCHSHRRCSCGDPPPAGRDSARRRPARLLSTPSPPARLPPAASLRAASPSGGCQLPAAAG